MREQSAGDVPRHRIGRERLVIGFMRKQLITVTGLLMSVTLLLMIGATAASQNPTPNSEAPKKANSRPSATPSPKADPFDKATVEQMAGQCVSLTTEQGTIVIEMLPMKAPEAVRGFLNLAASGALDTTTFSRVVPGFVIQGGNLQTSEKWSQPLADRMGKHLPDEPSDLKHERGIVSMARSDEPNSATTHFFILVGAGPHLDGKFSAFGRVRSGIEVADAINHAPSEGETPTVPVRISHAQVSPCAK
jgi:peptidyl-prolyl cis-trans isomerase B (cyclophilin B)